MSNQTETLESQQISVEEEDEREHINMMSSKPESVNIDIPDATDALELRNSAADYLMLDQYENALKHLCKSLKYEPINTLTSRLLVYALKHVVIDYDVRILNLTDYQLGDTGVIALASFLRSTTFLTSLDLGGNKIGDTGATALAIVLKSNTSLTSLNLCNNEIGDTGATALAIILKSNTSLTSLNLCNNEIGDTGATAFAKALKSNTSLISLNFQYNKIGNTGAIALAIVLKPNISLTSLNLHNNEIKDIDTALAIVLYSNTSSIFDCGIYSENASKLGLKYKIKIYNYILIVTAKVLMSLNLG